MRRIDVVGIGNAIVDVLSHADDRLLAEHQLEKGSMTLIDADQATALYNQMGPGVEISGGSAANTMAGIAALGGRAAFIGKVSADQLGSVFTHDIRAIGVEFDTAAGGGGPPTARCLIFVTPDAQRTMCTYLGACVTLGPDDIDEELIASAGLIYVEGYLWDEPNAKEAILKAISAARRAGTQVALTLSDSFCVDRHRSDFRKLAKDVDILFANEAEILSLYQVEAFDDALQAVRVDNTLAALTRSENGSVIVARDELHVIDASRDFKVIDTTGAGDLYAAGFLAGLAEGKPLKQCGQQASLAAAEVISHMGARPEQDLRKLVAEKIG
jgi:sugar/nucleoside kinase (ribokinase family)